MKRISQIEWRGPETLNYLWEHGIYNMTELVDILDEEAEALDDKLSKMKIVEEIDPKGRMIKRLYFVADELRAKIDDLGDALYRFKNEIAEDQNEHPQFKMIGLKKEVAPKKKYAEMKLLWDESNPIKSLQEYLKGYPPLKKIEIEGETFVLNGERENSSKSLSPEDRQGPDSE